MKLFARIGTMLTVMTAVAMGTAGAASATPDYFYALAKHSSGVQAASTYGYISWSTSRRTVTLSNWCTFVKGGEEGSFTWTAYQGQTQVGNGLVIERNQVGKPNSTICYEPFNLTTTVPGGIDRVDISAYDDTHLILGWSFCKFSQPYCT